jgi:hypothetical protein
MHGASKEGFFIHNIAHKANPAMHNIRCNLRIATHNFESCPLAGIRCMLLLKSTSVPFPGKTVSEDAQVFQGPPLLLRLLI